MKIPQFIEDHKHLFGAYSAMALSNVFNVLDHIASLADIENNYTKENPWEHPCMEIINSKKTHSDASKTEYVVDKLKSHFPFAAMIAEINRQKQATKHLKTPKGKQKMLACISHADIYQTLNKMFRVLKTYRDYTTHYLQNNKLFDNGSDFLKYSEQPLSRELNNYLTVALRDTATKYSYAPEALSFIQSRRFKDGQVGGKKMKVVDTDFFLSIIHNNGDSQNSHISGIGICMLICMFLEKKYVNIFLQKLPIYGIYQKQSLEANIIRQTFSIHTIKLPKERIHSDKSDFSIALDMLNELKRCPKELFSTLSYPDQNAFRTVSSDMSDVLQIRHSDRFPQLALEYIDRNKLFEKIRFHVNMGKLRYLMTADKHCVDGMSRVRVLENKINGFGRTQEFEQKRIEKGFRAYREQGDKIIPTNESIEIRDFEHVKRDDGNPDNYPYIVDTYTHYIIENNKVEMYFGDYWPDLVNTTGQKWTVYNEKPKCRMSILELPAMMFHMMLCGKKATEKRIINEVEKYERLFDAMANRELTKKNINSFGIALCDMPDKVIDSVNGKSSPRSLKKHIANEIADALTDTNKRIERLKADKKMVLSAQNKMGKKGFRSIQPGKLAAWIASDIVKHQPTLATGDNYGTDRITGLNFRVMQSAIATFNGLMQGHSFDDLKRLFAAAKLIQNTENAHPFLQQALNTNPQNTVEFYENYLLAKREYYQKLRTSLATGQNIKLPYLNPLRNKWMERNATFYETMGEIYRNDMPIELPRQMFDADIKQRLSQLPEMSGVNMRESNATYLIAEYIKRVLNDNFQPFYNWERNYRYTDMLVCEENQKTHALKTLFLPLEKREKIWEQRNELKESYKRWAVGRLSKNPNTKRLSSSEKEELLNKRIANCRNEYQKNEKLIRRYKVQDAVMMMMVKEMFKHSSFTIDSKHFSLAHITPDAERGILSEVIPIDFCFSIGGKEYTIHSNGMKIKNYGDFHKIINDRRIKSLLNILRHPVVNKELLETEFRNYDDMRPEAVKVIFEFEKAAFEKHPELITLAKNAKHFDFKALLAELQNQNDLTTDNGDCLKLIRNAFNHNGYPTDLKITSNIPEIATDLINIFKITNPFKKNIN